LDSPGLYTKLIEPDVPKAAWRSIHQSIVSAVKDVWNCVRNVLCNDAPEGNVPMELEDEVNMTTKDILSYSWRALKEARQAKMSWLCNKYLLTVLKFIGSSSRSKVHQPKR
jgi:Putative death-receptor fusion protein (DUF2428)